MIVCSECHSAQFLQIVQSEVGFEGDGEPRYVLEEYVCTLCGSEGTFDSRRGPKERALSGALTYTKRRPKHA